MSKSKEIQEQCKPLMGIDYGSKLAGTTALAWLDINGKVNYTLSKKNQDADQFILDFVKQLNIKTIGIDAPLSIPLGLTSKDSNENCFYRTSDRDLGAMSPMFLGGLTARAIHLNKQLESDGIQTFETYPAASVKLLQAKHFYLKKDNNKIPNFIDSIQSHFPFELPQTTSWHVIDACICLSVVLKISNKTASFAGNEEERIWY